MPCLLGCLALFFPRVVIVLLAIFSTYLNEAYQTFIWPFLGFLFLPLTTLAYAWAYHLGDGNIQGVGLVVVVLAVLFDLGLLGAGERGRRHYRRRY